MNHRRLVAEWEPQSGTMITWPHESTDWGLVLGAVENVYVELTHQITRFQDLLVCCYDRRHRHAITGLLRDAGVDQRRIRFSEVRFNDTWVRDYGPLCVNTGGHIELHDFRFNGWGGKYSANQDNLVTREVHRQGHFRDTPLQSHDWILEGGSIDGDGDVTLLVTRAPLLSAGRNPGVSQTDVEAEFSRLFGVERVHWLDHGVLAGDDTDGHIDTLARFCDLSTIVYTTCTNRRDSQYADLHRMASQLKSFRQADGSPYRLVPLPLPTPKYHRNGRRLPANYANFLLTNGAVMVPLYNDPADRIALQTLGRCFPRREVIGIDSLPLVQEAGSVHCATMHLATGVLRTPTHREDETQIPVAI
ncbi:MAG: agmatine deiminase family protein [Gammaproteobacteria bacterium]|nr:agmatine deiminase family protein [Gammaproteobacteria bacterium]